MTGGPDDVAYGNAQTDFNNIKKVPVVWACMTSAGHGATYWDPRGGDFGRVAIKWMDWQLKGYSENASIFLKPDNVMFPKWNIQKRNFGDVDYENVYATPVTVGDPVFDRQAAEETFAFGADVSLLTQQTQSGKVFNTEPPYTLRWTDPEPGLHNIFAQATATDGETASTDVVKIEVSTDVTAINAVIAPNDIQLKAIGNKVSIESGTPLRHIRIYSINGMLLSEKKVNGTHRASLSVNAQQRNMLLLVQVETDAGTKTFHVRL